MSQPPTVIAGALGECVHVAGIHAFLRLAEAQGYRPIFLGPAVPVAEFIGAIRETDAPLVAVSYRLTPETGEAALRRFIEAVRAAGLTERRFAFGGTPPVAARARALGFFEACFDGTEPPEAVIAFLQGRPPHSEREEDYAPTLLGRLAQKHPFPLLRHHYGRPTMEETLAGIREIAEARVLDIISLGPDQDAQENFFHPERQDPARRGAGGVPVRSPEDFRALYAASRCGNFPLMRTYAGTNDLLRLAEVHVETIHNCFCAVPLVWFSQLDGRGPLTVAGRIRTSQEVMRFYAERNIPVEVNEPHHWSMRDAPDVVFVAAAYLSAYHAKRMGVRDYVAQFMFNSPAGVSFPMDLAKMLASLELIGRLANDTFRIHVETRAGLLSYPADPEAGKGQLASSTMLQMALRPAIVHVVAYCEADHAATAAEVIESCRIARQVIANALHGLPDMTCDPAVQERRQELFEEAGLLLEALRTLGGDGVEDPLLDPVTLAAAVRLGFLDAPQIQAGRGGSLDSPGCGKVVTRLVDGACRAVDPSTGKVWSEEERLRWVWEQVPTR